jgi:hypothetical protein
MLSGMWGFGGMLCLPALRDEGVCFGLGLDGIFFRNRQRQEQPQIPFGDDNQKTGNDDGKSDYNGRSDSDDNMPR